MARIAEQPSRREMQNALNAFIRAGWALAGAWNHDEFDEVVASKMFAVDLDEFLLRAPYLMKGTAEADGENPAEWLNAGDPLPVTCEGV